MRRKSLVELLEAYITEEDTPIPQYQIYCDMDGVLTNFDERFDHYTGFRPSEYESKYGVAKFWSVIDEIGVKYWSHMGWMPNGKKLWGFISKYNPKLLTSPSRDESSRVGKKIWAKRELGGNVPVIFKYSKGKKDYANQSSILIDDRESNIQQWNESGGIGLHVRNGNIAPVIKKLKELGYK